MIVSRPTVKTVIFSTEDKYRKEKMLERLKSRNMISTDAEKFITKGRR